MEAIGPTFNYPTNIANAGDIRIFVLEQDGFIWILKSDGTVPPTPDGSGGWNRNNHRFSGNRWVAFGEDNNGELYALTNPLGSGQVYKIKEDLLSTNDMSFSYKFSIIPNPSNGNIINLNFNKPTLLKEANAINLQGQKIKASIKTINSTSAKIEFNAISSGIYIIETISNRGEKSQNKLIIK